MSREPSEPRSGRARKVREALRGTAAVSRGKGLTRALSVAALVVASALLIVLVGRPLATDDTWWHLVLGALYAGGDLWPREDPLLHTTVLRAPLPHEWLFQVGLHGLVSAGGFPALRIFHVASVLAIVAGAGALFQRAGRDLSATSAALLVLVALSWFRWMQLRPDAVTVLAILALYALVMRDEQPVGPRRLALGLALMLAWVNVHSLFAIGLCLVLAAILGNALHALFALAIPRRIDDADPLARCKRLLLFLVLAVGVTWVNPRGFDQHLTFFAESQAGLIWKIQDDFLPYRPFVPASAASLAFTPLAFWLANALYASFFASAALRLLRLRRRRSAAALDDFDAVHFGLGLAAFVASLVAVRFHWLALFPLLYLLRPLAATPLAAPRRRMLAGVSVAVAIALPVAAGAPALRAEVARESGGYWRSDWLDVRYCGAGARFLEETGIEGRLYHPFNLGGFLGHQLAPRLRTFIDGRLDHVPAEVLDDYLTIRRTSRLGPTAPLRQRLDRWGVDLFFADTFPEAWYVGRESGFHLRRLPEWIPVWIARTHAIYLRRNPRNRANLARAARYYAERGIPFDRQAGLDVARVMETAPELARELQLVLPGAAVFERLVGQGDDPARVRGLRMLARHAWRIGDFERQVALDRELVGLRPGERDPALRLGDALLRLGRPRQARVLLEALELRLPNDSEVRLLARESRSVTN